MDHLQPVRRVRISRERIIVVLKTSVHVWKFSLDPKRLSVHETTENPEGLCCLSSKLLAFPGGTPGQVHLVELATGNVTIVPAHSSSLRAIDISPDGEVMATASEQVSGSFVSFYIPIDTCQGTLIRIFRTSNGAKIAELRRGVDHSKIFCLKISPNSQQIAVTSDKSTLHIFDVPHPTKPSVRDTSTSRLTSMGGNGGSLSPAEEVSSQKWGFLSKVPLLPRVFSDTYSFASATFELGKHAAHVQQQSKQNGGFYVPGEDGTTAPKGIIGWTSDQSIVVLGSGENGVWEKFIIAEGEDGRRYCLRQAWKKYLAAV